MIGSAVLAPTLGPWDSSPMLVAFLLQAVGAIVSPEPSLRPIIVLDPGHGGHNRGAYGAPIRRYEKRLTLQLARLTAAQLLEYSPAAKVLITRQRDRYLSLMQRVKYANHARALAFVSIHCNASEEHTQQGFETYVLSPKLADIGMLGGRPTEQSALTLGDLDPVDAIVTDLKRRALGVRSRALAQMIQQGLADTFPRAINRGVQQAPFDVLMGLDMPGVLVEIGFIDHPIEAQAIRKLEYQHKLAAALSLAILHFLRRTVRDYRVTPSWAKARSASGRAASF